MNIEHIVLGCAGPSPQADYVTDYAAWAAARLGAPLELLHVIERHPERGTGNDRSGATGVDAQAVLLSKLAADDEQQVRALREAGRLHLDGLRRRGLRKPVLAVSAPFRPVERVMIAFDGGVASRHGVGLVAGSPLFAGCTITLLMAGREHAAAGRQLDWARQVFEAAGRQVTATLEPGPIGDVIPAAVQAAAIDLLVMGAYSHAPLRALVRSSRTSALLGALPAPALLMR